VQSPSDLLLLLDPCTGRSGKFETPLLGALGVEDFVQFFQGKLSMELANITLIRAEDLLGFNGKGVDSDHSYDIPSSKDEVNYAYQYQTVG
jgi:hypothetical protein